MVSIAPALALQNTFVQKEIKHMELSPAQALQKYFKLQNFRPAQQEIIENLIAGNSTLATLPTGAGKSLTYQLPSFLLREKGITLIISPLLSLIRDQVEKLKHIGISVCQIDSTLTNTERQKNLEDLESGKIQLVYTSPESLSNSQLFDLLKKLDIALITIDEVHCYSEWGHSFRSSYLSLPKLTRALKPFVTLALTATATRKTTADIRKAFQIKKAHHISLSPRRENLQYKVIPCHDDERKQQLLDILTKPNHLPAILYAMRQEHCEEISHHLTQHGIPAKSYHAGMAASTRELIQDEFLQDRTPVIVATIAFGMGIDKSNIRSIIHYHLPKSPEGWVQESGRAGRDAAAATNYLLACGDDIVPLKNFIRARELSKYAIQRLINSLTSHGKNAVIQPYHARVSLGMLNTTLDVILAKLELLKITKYTHSSWRYVKMNILFGRHLNLNDYPRNHHKALSYILKSADRYDLHNAQSDFGVKDESLYKTLMELKHSGDCYMRFSGWQKHYKILTELTAEQLNNLSEELDSYHKQQLISDEERLHEVLRICTSKACIPSQFEKWFGSPHQSGNRCQNCSSCLGDARPGKLPRNPLKNNANLTLDQLQQVKNLLIQKKRYLKTPSQLTCMLCGIGTPYIRHYRLHYHPLFGAFEGYDYDDMHAYSLALIT